MDLGTDQTESSITTTSLPSYLPSYLLMGPMRGERLRYNISMNNSSDNWKRRGENRQSTDQESSRSKLGQGGLNRLNDKVQAIPDCSSWGMNGWELLPPVKQGLSEHVDLDMESQDLDTPPLPLVGCEKLELKQNYHHNHSKSSPQSLSPNHLRQSRWSHNRAHSKDDQDGGTSPVVPLRGEGYDHAKRMKLKHHGEYGSHGNTRRPYF